MHLNDTHELSFGEQDGVLSDRVKAIAGLMEGVRFNPHASTEILLEMWEKWIFLASLAGSTCLMRAAIGDICVSPDGVEFILGLVEECRSIAAAEGYPMREAKLKRARDMLTANGSNLTASMLRDIERNAPIEADHIIGDLLRRREYRVPGQAFFARHCLHPLESVRGSSEPNAGTSPIGRWLHPSF